MPGMFAGRGADDEDGACIHQKHVEASEKAQEGTRNTGAATRAAVAKARPSKVLKKNGTIAVGMAGQTPGKAELDTVVAAVRNL
jgi:hypothetical protein